MTQRIFVLVGLIALSIFAFSSPVLASSSDELPQVERTYDFQSDPYLLEWTFLIEKNADQSVVLSAEDKILNRWKEKQSRMWDTLPIGKKLVINASAYTAAADECGKNDGVTSSGLKVEEGRTLACPAEYPFGTMIKIDGIGTLRCEDRGGAIKGNHFDIYMKTKSDAFAFGRRHLEAEIVEN